MHLQQSGMDKLHLPIPTPNNEDYASSGVLLKDTSRTSNVFSSLIGSSAIDVCTSQLASAPSTTGTQSNSEHEFLTVHELHESSHVDFLHKAFNLRIQNKDSLVTDIHKGFTQSSTRQYKSGWKLFKSFIKSKIIKFWHFIAVSFLALPS